MINIAQHISLSLLNDDLNKIIRDNIRLFHNKLKKDAPYAEIIGYLTDYELVKTDLACGGWCSRYSKEIAYVNGGLSTIFHEIGHAFQAKCGIIKEEKKILLSQEIAIEQQAETIAYVMYNKLIGHSNNFTSYFKIEDIKFLDLWYKDSEIYENDLKIKFMQP
jgi:hypothetical protein